MIEIPKNCRDSQGMIRKKHKRKMILLRKGRANFRQHKEKVNVNRKKIGKSWQKKELLCQAGRCWT